MKSVYLIFCMLLAAFQGICSKGSGNDIYQIQVYHLKDNEQVQMTDHFLKDAFLPAMHRFGIRNIGVFKPLTNDTASVKLIYVLIPFSSVDQWVKISDQIDSDPAFKLSAKDFLNADSKNPPYERIESILLKAFQGQPFLHIPRQKDPERILELRSYESPTRHLFEKKMGMFNSGEIKIFTRLGFDPVFYAQVISGSRMPNLMYMPVFKSVDDRNAQWKRFGNDPAWKDISGKPENENKVSVSHIDSILMHSAEYSDY